MIIDGFVSVILCSQQSVCNLTDESVVLRRDAGAATQSSASSLTATCSGTSIILFTSLQSNINTESYKAESCSIIALYAAKQVSCISYQTLNSRCEARTTWKVKNMNISLKFDLICFTLSLPVKVSASSKCCVYIICWQQL